MKRTIALTALAAAMVLGSVPAMAAENSSDIDLRGDVRTALWRIHDVRHRHMPGIGVRVHDGVVTLRGEVGGGIARMRAGQAARSVAGVHDVHNYLHFD